MIQNCYQNDNYPNIQAGDEIGKDFGWIGHADCKSKCPNKCDKKKWQYWKGKTSSKDGVWDFDHSLRVEGTLKI